MNSPKRKQIGHQTEEKMLRLASQPGNAKPGTHGTASHPPPELAKVGLMIPRICDVEGTGYPAPLEMCGAQERPSHCRCGGGVTPEPPPSAREARPGTLETAVSVTWAVARMAGGPTL